MKKDTNIYYIRYDQGRQSVVFTGTFQHLKFDVFQGTLQAAKDRSTKPFRWPRDIYELVKTLNYCTSVLGNTSDFYTLTDGETARRKHWPIIDKEEDNESKA